MPTTLQTCLLAAGAQGAASTGFLLGTLLATIVTVRTTKGAGPLAPTQRSTATGFSGTLLLIEGIDAIPEALVIAQTVALAGHGSHAVEEGSPNLTVFVAAVIVANTASALATGLDWVSFGPSRQRSRFLCGVLLFAIGMLLYTISATLLGPMVSRLRVQSWPHSACLVVGFLVGALLIAGLLSWEHKVEAREAAKAALLAEDGPVSGGAMSGVVGAEAGGAGGETDPLVPASSTTGTGVAQLADAVAALENLAQLEEVLLTSVQNESSAYASRVRERAAGRLASIRRLLDLSAAMGDFRSAASTLRIGMDAETVVVDLIQGEADQLGLFGTGAVPTKAIVERGRGLFVTFLLIGTFSAAIAAGFARLFVYLATSPTGGFLRLFAEGFSGGAFLATISSVLMPRAALEAYKSHWSRFAYRAVSIGALNAGVLIAMILHALTG